MTKVDVQFIVVGEAAVGKTTMVATLNDRHYCRVEPTIGVEFTSRDMEVNSAACPAIPGGIEPVTVKVWDTAGQERYRALIHGYFRNKAAAFLVFDVTNSESFRACNFWWRELQKNSNNSQMVIVLVGNKCEAKMEPRRRVSHTAARDWAKDHGISYYEISARQNDRVKEMFQETLLKVLTLMDLHPRRRRASTLDPRSSYLPITNPSPGVTISHTRPSPESSWGTCCTLM